MWNCFIISTHPHPEIQKILPFFYIYTCNNIYKRRLIMYARKFINIIFALSKNKNNTRRKANNWNLNELTVWLQTYNLRRVILVEIQERKKKNSDDNLNRFISLSFSLQNKKVIPHAIKQFITIIIIQSRKY